MNCLRTLAIGLIVLLFAPPAQSQDHKRYRDYRLGSDLKSVAALAKIPVAGAKTVHERPSLIQDLEWRQPYLMIESATKQSDPVQRMVFSFYDDQLFRVVISYDRRRTSGLTDPDMIEALSATYGAALLLPSANLPVLTGPLASDLGAPIAQWGDVDYSVGLYRSSFARSFASCSPHRGSMPWLGRPARKRFGWTSARRRSTRSNAGRKRPKRPALCRRRRESRTRPPSRRSHAPLANPGLTL
jgi:hypothetical protein